MQTIAVELGDRTYPIHVGEGLLGDAPRLHNLIKPFIRGRQVVVFSNERVNELYGGQVRAALSDYSVEMFVMGDGERYKNLETYTAAMDFLMAGRHNRTTCIIALGGGVVGDVSGFVAATFQRGVDFLQIPTTLLAQVDSSVGGKTAVNHPLGKNMIGAFYQPQAVIIDSRVLSSLSDREYAAGLAEVVKYGIIADAGLFEWLEANVGALGSRDGSALAHVIKRSCEIKADVVARDEREAGVRAILNYGHTFGHAIENLAGYGSWLHGEAVALGMVMAARFSERLHRLPAGQADRIAGLLRSLDLPVELGRRVGVDGMLKAMAMDKKAVDGNMRFVVSDGIGSASLTADFKHSVLTDLLAEFC